MQVQEDTAFFRQAERKEIDFYFNTLYPLQDKVLESIKTGSFYLTGGTALSRFYYRHRFSDDLDFFYDGYGYVKEQFNFSFRDIIYRLEGMFDKIEVTIDSEFFKRVFLSKRDTSLKVEFIYENYKTVGDKKEFQGTLIDSRENICANKIGTVSDRRSVKDFIDLYYLLKDIDLEKAIEWSAIKKVPPDYEGMMMAVGDLPGNPHSLEGTVLTIQPLDRAAFINFTQKLVKDLLKDAKNR